MADRLFSTYQVAELLGATPGMVVEWMQKGLLPYSKSPEGPVRVPEKALVQFLKERGVDLPGIMSRLAAQEQSIREEAPPAPQARRRAGTEATSKHLAPAQAAPPRPAAPAPAERPPDQPAQPRRIEMPVASLPEPPQPAPPANADQLVRSLLTQAVDAGAGAVHLQTTPQGLTVRLNVDSLLRSPAGLDQPLKAPAAAELADRLRRLAHVPASPRPQDPPAQGLFDHPAPGRSVVVRLIDQPTPAGRRIVLHLADPARAASLDALNLPQSQRDTLRQALDLPHGLILVAGSDRAGRRDLLHAMLNELAARSRRSATIERPTDLPLAAARSIVDPLAGQSIGQWAWMLPGLDAQAVMVSDLADPRTALAAMEAADEALVLAGIDAADPAAALVMLMEMGIEPCPLSLRLRLVAHAAAVRLLCPACKKPDPQAAERLARLGFQAQPFDAQSASGCPACGQSGYAGRAVILGLARGEDDLARALRSADRDALAAAGTTLLQAGLAKARAGLTSLAELERVLVR